MIDYITVRDDITPPLDVLTNKKWSCPVESVFFLSCSQRFVEVSRVAVLILDHSWLVPPATIWRLTNTHKPHLGKEWQARLQSVCHLPPCPVCSLPLQSLSLSVQCALVRYCQCLAIPGCPLHWLKRRWHVQARPITGWYPVHLQALNLKCTRCWPLLHGVIWVCLVTLG